MVGNLLAVASALTFLDVLLLCADNDGCNRDRWTPACKKAMDDKRLAAGGVVACLFQAKRLERGFH